MKNLFLTFLMLTVLAVPFLAAQSIDGYIINGHIRGLADKSKIFLIDGSQRKAIDSAVVSNERFVLKGKLSEPVFTYLYSGKTNKLANILLDNHTIIVRANQPLYDSLYVSGSEIDEQWRDWYRQDQHIGYQRYRLNQVYLALVEKKDTVHAPILKQLVDELTHDRTVLLKGYVKRYHDSPVGALLPTLCTLQHQLTKEDYLEMYSLLSAALQNTALGKEILQQAYKNKNYK